MIDGAMLVIVSLALMVLIVMVGIAAAVTLAAQYIAKRLRQRKQDIRWVTLSSYYGDDDGR